MPKRSTEFQRFVRLMEQALAGRARVEESVMVKDATGTEREVDVVVTSNVGTHPVAIAIEVIEEGRKATVEWVDQMVGKHRSLPFHKLVLVSKSGFTNTAISSAGQARVEIATYQELSNTDWPLALALLDGGCLELGTFVYRCDAMLRAQDGTVRLIENINRSMLVALPYRPQQPTTVDLMVRHFLNDGRVIDVLQANSSRDGSKNQFTCVYKPERGFMISVDAAVLELQELRIRLEHSFTQTPFSFSCARYSGAEFGLGTSKNSSERPMHFALRRHADGTVKGYLIDVEGVRTIEGAPPSTRK